MERDQRKADAGRGKAPTWTSEGLCFAKVDWHREGIICLQLSMKNAKSGPESTETSTGRWDVILLMAL